MLNGPHKDDWDCSGYWKQRKQEHYLVAVMSRELAKSSARASNGLKPAPDGHQYVSLLGGCM